MGKVRVGLNGFGRIGRLVFRMAYDCSLDASLDFVLVNEGSGSGESSAYLCNYDSVHGKWGEEMRFCEEKSEFVVEKDGKRIKYTREMKVEAVDWSGCDLVLECTGAHLTRAKLQNYFDQGVKKVVVSAPVKDAENPVLNIVYGVNENA